MFLLLLTFTSKQHSETERRTSEEKLDTAEHAWETAMEAKQAEQHGKHLKKMQNRTEVSEKPGKQKSRYFESRNMGTHKTNKGKKQQKNTNNQKVEFPCSNGYE